jgi:predicted DsbA family dithiol-disulfide isomerase
LRFQAWPEDRPTPSSSLVALAAARCARQQGEQAFERFDLALYRAYFEQCRDISDRETILDVADEVGLERKPFLAALESGMARAAVLADHQEYRERFGRFQPGIPLLELDDGRQIAGAVPLESYYAAVAQRLGS